MLYENKDYGKSLQSFARASSYFAFFANITIEIVKGIQSVLRSMYSVINKNYLSLSREMEFHADAVAASVSGGNNLISALKRVELGGACYNITLQKCDEIFKEKLISKNIFQNQLAITNEIAAEMGMTVKDGLPLIKEENLFGQNFTRVNFKDQWASHPTTQERQAHLEQLGINVEPEAQLAWALFRDRLEWQEKLTTKIYEKIKTDDTVMIGEQDFSYKYKRDRAEFSLPLEYKNFYDGRRVPVLAKEDFENFTPPHGQPGQIFSEENVSLPGKIGATEKDIDLLKAMKEKKIPIKSFDFDGEKYDVEKATAILSGLENELDAQRKTLAELDKKVINLFCSQASKSSPSEGEILKGLYMDYFENCTTADEFLNFLNQMMGDLGSIYRGETIPVSTIQSMIATLKNTNEIRFKDYLKRWLAVGVFNNKVSLKKDVEDFIDSQYKYFDSPTFREDELRFLGELVNASWQAVNGWLFLKFKNILLVQLPFFPQNQ
jgi:hypothetical protein